MSSISLTLRTAELVPIIINVFVDLSTLATIASEVALISAVKAMNGTQRVRLGRVKYHNYLTIPSNFIRRSDGNPQYVGE